MTSTVQRRGASRAVAVGGVVAVAGLLTVVLSAGFGRDPRIVPSVHMDRPAPPLAGETLEGGRFDRADHAGKVVVVNFWASWCTACKREHPDLVAAATRLRPFPVQFVGVNSQDTVEDARAVLAEMGAYPYPSVVDPRGTAGVDWGIFGVPETFVVDPRGRVRAKVSRVGARLRGRAPACPGRTPGPAAGGGAAAVQRGGAWRRRHGLRASRLGR